jgi:Fic family protein
MEVIVERESGRYEVVSAGGENVRAFVPQPLPPVPALEMDGPMRELLRGAETGLARLDAAGKMVPSVEWFVYAFVRKEAVISSQIEGTQASLSDLLHVEAELPGNAPPEDVEEICNYLDALNYARGELRGEDGLPVSMRLLNGAHRRLLSGTRGRDKQPGQVRRSQNWIGGTRPGNARFVPPPAPALAELLSDLERYLHDDRSLPPLVRAGLIHAQFETLHPYLDGNGRVGRLLISLCLEAWDLLTEPLLYLSLHFKRHRSEYYDRLDAVRARGDWEGWTRYFLEGVSAIAGEAGDLVSALFALTDRDRRRLVDSPRATVVSIRLFDQLPKHPIVTSASVSKLCDTTRPTATKAIDILREVGVLEETSGKDRDRTWCYREYLDRLRVGTDLGD